MTPKQIVLADSSVKAAAAIAIPAKAKFQTTMESLEIPLYPQQFLDAAKLKMNQARTADQIAAAKAHLFNLQGDAAESGRIAARRLAFAALEEFKKTLPPLIDAAKAVLAREADKAKAAELAFFKAHGCDYEETAVSKRLRGLAAEIAHLNHCLTDTSPAGRISVPARNTYAHVVEWFKDAP
jgi:DNA phosphorothioation-dependent restriction protein DptG